MLAEPATSGDVPSDVAPSKNSMEPPGPPAPGGTGTTVAVSVVLCPNSVGFGELVSAVAVAAWFTVCACTADVLVVKLALPASEAVLMLALPATSGAVPSDVAPSKNSTDPVAVPAPGGFTATLAVSATLSPNADGLGALVTLVVVVA